VVFHDFTFSSSQLAVKIWNQPYNAKITATKYSKPIKYHNILSRVSIKVPQVFSSPVVVP